MQGSLSVLILDKNENSREVIKNYLEELKVAKEIQIFSDFELGYEILKQNDKDRIVFLDISENCSELQPIIELIKTSSSKFVFTSFDTSTDTIIKAFRLGAIELLPKPILKSNLIRIIDNLKNYRTNNAVNNSKIITFYSNKGGIGKTTLATNLAIELARETKNNVALIDLNLQLGDISTFLNLTPSFNIGTVITKIFQEENSGIKQWFEKYKDLSLYILSDPQYIEQSMSITPQQIARLFQKLKEEFTYIIVDMSSNIDEKTLKILDLSDWIMFSSIVNISSIRNAQRCLTLFNSRNYPSDKVKIIINRYMENDDISISDIEQALNKNIYWKVPNNYFTIIEAINKGVSVYEINSKSNISLNFKDFAIKISDDIIEQNAKMYTL